MPMGSLRRVMEPRAPVNPCPGSLPSAHPARRPLPHPIVRNRPAVAVVVVLHRPSSPRPPTRSNRSMPHDLAHVRLTGRRRPLPSNSQRCLVRRDGHGGTVTSAGHPTAKDSGVCAGEEFARTAPARGVPGPDAAELPAGAGDQRPHQERSLTIGRAARSTARPNAIGLIGHGGRDAGVAAGCLRSTRQPSNHRDRLSAARGYSAGSAEGITARSSVSRRWPMWPGSACTGREFPEWQRRSSPGRTMVTFGSPV